MQPVFKTSFIPVKFSLMMNEKLIPPTTIRVSFDEENKEYYLNELYNVYCPPINLVLPNTVLSPVYLYTCFGENHTSPTLNSIENLEQKNHALKIAPNTSKQFKILK